SSISDRYVIDAWAVPGDAGAPAAPEGASLEWFASRAAEAITATGAAPVHVLGAGWGAMVAMQLVVDHPDLVRSVALVDGYLTVADADPAVLRDGGIDARARDRAAALTAPGASDAVIDRVGRILAEGVAVDGYAAAAAAGTGVDLATGLRRVRKPAVVITGEQAGVEPAARSQQVATAFPESVQEAVHGAGSLTHLERPEVLAEWLRSFLYIVDQVREDRDQVEAS